MVLSGIRVCPHVKPANALHQRNHCGKPRGRHQFCGTPACDPLQTHQKRQLSIRCFRQGYGVAHEPQHSRRRFFLPDMGAGIAIRRIGHDAAAAARQHGAMKKIHPRLTESAIGNIGRHHLVSMGRQDRRHRPRSTARFPNRSAKTNMPQQRFRDPGRGGIKIPAFSFITGNMHRTPLRRVRYVLGGWLTKWKELLFFRILHAADKAKNSNQCNHGR